MYENRLPIDILTSRDVQRVLKKGPVIRENIVVRGEHLTRLTGVEEIDGHLGISESSIEDLGDLRLVRGDLWISGTRVRCEIRSLGHLEEVGGDLGLRYSQVMDLGDLRRVGGNLSLRDTPIENLGKLEMVGGNLFLPKRLENKIDVSKLSVAGAIKYWNDTKTPNYPKSRSELSLVRAEKAVPFWRHEYIFSTSEIKSASRRRQTFYQQFREAFLNGISWDLEGNSNYAFSLLYDLFEQYEATGDMDFFKKFGQQLGVSYPVTLPYAERMLIEASHRMGDYEYAWQKLYASDQHISVKDIFEFGRRLRRSVVDGKLIARLGGFAHLTEFGRRNIDSIREVALEHLRDFEQIRERPFIEVFFQEMKIDSFGSKALKAFSPNYYKEFFPSASEFEYWKALDKQQAEKKLRKDFKHLPEKAVFSQLRQFLSLAEDTHRERIGMPRVGEGWISETELYYKLKMAFPELEISQHGRPKWLGQQSFDVFFPDARIGVEYQGVQHYRAVSLFGGEDNLLKNRERDRRKLHLSRANRHSVVYVYEGYDFDQVSNHIRRLLSRTEPEVVHVNLPAEANGYLTEPIDI